MFYGEPSRKLKLVGVTGTNGKTTIATLLYEMFREFGYKVGLLSTVCNYIDDKAIPADHTTPDPIELNRLLGDMVAEGCEYAFMEMLKPCYPSTSNKWLRLHWSNLYQSHTRPSRLPQDIRKLS